MNRTRYLIALFFLLQACSAPGLSSGPKVTATKSPTSTPTETRTPTSTPTKTARPRNTSTPLFNTLSQTPPGPLNIPGFPTITQTGTATPLTPGDGFVSVQFSDKELFWGICKPHFLSMTVKVAQPDVVAIVYLFFRVESYKTPGDVAPWVGTVADKHSNGIFTYRLNANNVPHRKDLAKAWINFQFVAVDKKDVEVGRTYIHARSVTLEPCE